ncbi:MAG TPA: regulatory iron-sulfur-containing complex subunit RicT [Gemmatimonadales bacterium]|nr:regulatory iron-sulfur-containing complex subunit RicT [Gemmatimonadales bacterium]
MIAPQLVEVRFKGNRKAYFEWSEPEPLRAGEAVVVEAERGQDLGVVSAVGDLARRKCDRCGSCGSEQLEGGEPSGRESVRKVLRRATATDRQAAAELRNQEDDVRRKVREKVQAHGLLMKVSDAEWQWDRNRLTIYFTADKRVDFRSLVRDLASTFRTRIELRQIGVRDEAARLSGVGRCGREYCSASWLPELKPIGLQIAKDQGLSLNPTQISGPCGRLLCCLRYEHEFYVQTRRRFPKEGKTVHTSRGAEKVVSIDIFRERVTLRAEDGTTRVVPLAELKAEMHGSQAGSQGPVDHSDAPATGVAASEGADLESPPPDAQTPTPGASPDPRAPAPGASPRRRRRRRRRRNGAGGP